MFRLSLIALLVGWLVIEWPWLSGAVTVPWDAKAQFLPQLQFLAQSLAKGESPLWAPYVFAGYPQVADPQSLLFSPPFVLLALIDHTPTAWSQDLTIYLMMLASAAALMLWFRDRGWHPLGGLIAGLAFPFGAAMAWRIQHVGQVMSLAYLPIVLLFLDRALNRRSLRYGVCAGIAAGFLVLGRDQVALLAVYFLIAFVVWHWLQAPSRKDAFAGSVLPLGAATIAGLCVVTAPVFLTYLITEDSNRPEIDLFGAGRGSLHPALFLTAFAPDVFGASGVMREYWGPPSRLWSGTELYIAQNMGVMYIGAAPILLLVWGTVAGIFWAPEIRLFTLALIVSAIYALGWYTPAFALFHAVVPGVDLYRRPADAVFHIGFFASVLAGYAMHRMLADAPAALAAWRRALIVIIPVAAFMAMLALAQHFGMRADAQGTIALSAALVGLSAGLLLAVRRWSSTYPLLIPALFIAFLIGDIAYSNGPGGATAAPPQTYEVLDPKTKNQTIALLKKKTAETASDQRRDRIEIVGFDFHWPNASLTHDLDNTLGYNPLRLGLYSRATGADDTEGLPEQRHFSPLMPSYRSPLADLLGLRFIATSVPIEKIDKSLKPGDLVLLAKTKDGFVYENPHALPRILFATEAAATDFTGLLASGAWPAVDFTKSVLLEGVTPAPQRRPGTVRIASYHNTEVVLDADSPDGGWVVLNDVWQPWWFVTVDGEDRPLLRANVLFRAVEVPAGRHRISFTFHPLRGALAELKDKMRH